MAHITQDLGIMPKVRVGKLNNMQTVRQEMARVYRSSRRKELSTQDMQRYIASLKTIFDVLDGSDLESRIGILEKISAINSGAH